MDDLLLHPSFKRIFQAVIFEKNMNQKPFTIDLKNVRIWSYSGPYFPAFGLNTERYSPSISPYLVRMRENTDQNNSVYRHFFRSPYDK